MEVLISPTPTNDSPDTTPRPASTMPLPTEPGSQVSNYMQQLLEEDNDAYKRQFACYLKEGIMPDMLEGVYTSAHAAIRADPSPAPKKEKPADYKPKSYKKQRMSLAQKKGRVAQKKAAFLALQ